MSTFNRLARAVVLAAAFAAVTATPLEAKSEKVVVGAPAPDFTLTLIDGTKITRDEMRGQVVVLNYWATWCGPCRKELPLLDGYYALYKKYGLRVFAVATQDEESVPLYQMKQLFTAMHMSPARRIKGPYDVIDGGVPTNVVIGRDGRVRYAQAGAFTLESLNAILIPLLKESPPPGVSAVPR